MRSTCVYAAAISAACALLLHPAVVLAQGAIIVEDTTIDANSPYNFSSFINVGSASASPTVTIVEGANLAGPVSAYFQSVIDIQGGSAGSITLYHNSTGSRSGGFAHIDAHENSTATVSGGSGGVAVFVNGTLTMTGGTANSAYASGNGKLNISGGSVGFYAQVHNSAILNISNITIGNPNNTAFTPNFEARNSSTATVATSTIAFDALAFDASTLDFTSVNVGRDLIAGNLNGSTQMDGGSIGRDLRVNSSAFSGSGITIGRTVNAQNMGTKTLTLSNTTIGGAVVGADANINLDNSTIAVLLMCSSGSVINMTGGSVGGNVLHNGYGRTSLAGVAIGGNVQLTSEIGRVTITGGTIGGNVDVTGNGTLTMSGAQVDGSVGASTGRVELADTTIDTNLIASGTTSLTVTGGTIRGNLTASVVDPTKPVSVTNAVVGGDVSVSNSAVAALQNTNVSFDLAASGNARVGYNGGTVQGVVNVTGASSLNLLAGTFASDLTASSSAQFEMIGGSIGGDVTAQGTSVLNLNGGNIAGTVRSEESATVNLDGAVLADFVDVLGNSTLNIKSGAIPGECVAGADGRINMSGGTVYGLGAFGASVVSVTDGLVTEAVNVKETATFNFSGGIVAQNAIAEEGGTLNMSGGAIAGGLGASDNSTVAVTGGQVVGGPASGSPPIGFVAHAFSHISVGGSANISQGGLVDGSATLDVAGGQISGKVTAHDSATVNLSGGSIDDLEANGDTLINITGGSVNNIVHASEDAVATMSGGSVSSKFGLTGNARLSFDGGEVDHIDATDNSSVAIANGKVDFRVDLNGNTTATIDNIRAGDGDYPFPPILSVSGHSVATINGGSLSTIFEFGDARVTMNGGTVDSGNFLGGDQVRLSERSQLAIHDGTIGTPVHVDDFSRLTMTGGHVETDAVSFNSVIASGQSNVLITGGEIGDNLEAHDSSTVQLSGGTVHRLLIGYENSVVIMTSGQVDGQAIFRDNSAFFYSGGTIVGGIFDQTSSRLAFADELGSEPANALSNSLFVYDSATINIAGFNLTATLVDPNYQGMFSLYQLSGVLGDGSTAAGLYFSTQNGTGASYVLTEVPEPASMALLLLGVAGALVRRRGGPLDPSADASRSGSTPDRKGCQEPNHWFLTTFPHTPRISTCRPFSRLSYS